MAFSALICYIVPQNEKIYHVRPGDNTDT